MVLIIDSSFCVHIVLHAMIDITTVKFIVVIPFTDIEALQYISNIFKFDYINIKFYSYHTGVLSLVLKMLNFQV